MLEKDPTTYTALTYTWVLLLASAGGLVAFIRRLNNAKEPQPLKILLIKLLGELVISAFAGIVTFYLCEHLETQSLLTAVLVAISGHLGGNAIDVLTKKIEKITDTTLTQSIQEKDDEQLH